MLDMQILNISLAERSYPIYIGQHTLQQAELLASHVRGQQIMIVTNKTIAKLYLAEITKILRHYQCDVTILPDGEQYKNYLSVQKIFAQLLKHQHHRNTTLIALGGGVIGDMTGFAAACYQRGVNFIQIPTTLLAQVDSSIGGKTGINFKHVKNLVGAFYQPQCVIIDIVTLKTLPSRELRAGFAEIIKAAIILDEKFFTWLEKNITRVLRLEPEYISEAIYRACHIKAEIVMQDECEENGLRKLLNFGHTFGHAIEAVTHYKTYLHGEAVAIGMMLAAKLSHQLNKLDLNICQRLEDLLKRCNLPTKLAKRLPVEKLIQSMSMDKKNENHIPQFILLNKIGDCYIANAVDLRLVRNCF